MTLRQTAEFDLRKLRTQTYAVDWTPFSLWCWEGICKVYGGACLVECSCLHHNPDQVGKPGFFERDMEDEREI